MTKDEVLDFLLDKDVSDEEYDLVKFWVNDMSKKWFGLGYNAFSLKKSNENTYYSIGYDFFFSVDFKTINIK